MKKIYIVLFSLILFTLATENAHSQKKPPILWRHQVNLDVGPKFPTGDLADNLNIGWGFNATYYYRIKWHFFVSACIGYNMFSYDIEGVDDNFSILPFLAGIRYNFSLSGFQPYVGIEGGMYFRQFQLIFPEANGVRTIDESEQHFGVNAKAGFRYPISPVIDFDASLKYHTVFAEESFSYLGLNIGLSYRFVQIERELRGE